MKCRPPGNRDPLPDEIAACRPVARAAARAHRAEGRRHPRQLRHQAAARHHRGHHQAAGHGRYPYARRRARPDVPPRRRAARAAASRWRRCGPTSCGPSRSLARSDARDAAATTVGRRDPRRSAAALAELARPGDLVLLAGDLGAGKTAFAQGFGRGLGVDEPVTSPTFTLARAVRRRPPAAAPPRRLPARAARRRSLDLGLPELLDDGGVDAHRVGRRDRAGAARRLPRGPPRASATATTTASLELRAGRARAGRPARTRRGDRRSSAGDGGPDVLILGIETATAAGRLRHRRPRGRARRRPTRPRAGATPRRSRPPSSSSAGRPRSSSTRSACVAVDLGPGLFTGLRVGVATAKAMAHALRVPMIGVSSLDLLAFPVRYTPPADRRRRSTPGGARSSTPSTARCPAACSGCREHAGRHARRPRVRAAGHAARTACSSATAPCATTRPSTASTRVEIADAGLAYPSAAVAGAAGPRPGAARGVRASRGSSQPLYLRKPDAEINWSTAGRPRERPRAMRRASTGSSTSASRRCAGATCARVLRIEAQVYPRPWSLGLFMSRAGAARRAACYLVAKVGGDVVGYAGLMFSGRRRPRHHHRRRPGVAPARASAPGCCSRCRRAAIARGRPSLTLEVRRQQRPRPRRCTGGSASRRPAIRKNYYAETERGRAGDVGPRHRHRRRTPSGSTSIEAAIPGDARSSDGADVSESTPWHDRSSASRRRATRRPRPSSSTARDVLSSVVSQPGRPARPLRRRRARDRQPGPRRAAHAGRRRRRWSRPASTTADVDAVAATVGPGLIGSLLVGVSRGQGAGAGVGRAVRRRQPPRGPPLRRRSSRSPTSSCPLVVLLVSGGHTMLVAHGGPRPLPAARPDHRRRRRRGVRQGGPLPRPRLPRRPGHRPRGHARATRRPSRFPRAMLDDGLRLLASAG